MKILVTGATSGLGRNAVQHLLEQGVETIGIGRNMEEGARLTALGVRFIPLDLTQVGWETCVRLMEGCDAVWHCAAKSAPWGDRLSFYQANVMATRTLAQAAGYAEVPRFIHISTPALYFDYQHHYNVPESYLAHTFACDYARSKYDAEQVITYAATSFRATTFVILRPRGLFGPHDNVIVPRLLKQLRRSGGVLRLPRGGDVLLDLTFTPNVVHAMAQATQHPLLLSASAFNVTNHQPLRLVNMMDRFLRQMLGLRFRIKTVGWPCLSLVARGAELAGFCVGKEPPFTRYSLGTLSFDMTLSMQQAVETLGYHPRFSMDEGFALTAEWMKAHGNNYCI